MGLCLTRKVGETIVIGDDVEITVIKAAEGRVKLRMVAPKSTRIVRKELLRKGGVYNSKSSERGA